MPQILEVMGIASTEDLVFLAIHSRVTISSRSNLTVMDCNRTQLSQWCKQNKRHRIKGLEKLNVPNSSYLKNSCIISLMFRLINHITKRQEISKNNVKISS